MLNWSKYAKREIKKREKGTESIPPYGENTHGGYFLSRKNHRLSRWKIRDGYRLIFAVGFP